MPIRTPDWNTSAALTPAPVAEQHAALASRLSGHVATLNSVRNRLLSVFQRTRALRRRLLEARPELQAAADTADAACEREREQPR